MEDAKDIMKKYAPTKNAKVAYCFENMVSPSMTSVIPFCIGKETLSYLKNVFFKKNMLCNNTYFSIKVWVSVETAPKTGDISQVKLKTLYKLP